MRGASVGLALFSGTALACSGPGAAAAIGRATLVGWACLAVSAVVTGVAVAAHLPLRSSLARVGAVVGALVLLAHPGAWLSASRGDCGTSLLLLAPTATLLHAVAAAFVWLRRPR